MRRLWVGSLIVAVVMAAVLPARSQVIPAGSACPTAFTQYVPYAAEAIAITSTSSAFLTASFPSPASATTCQLDWSSMMRRNPDLTTSWSSAIRIRIMITTPGVL